ncbi:MAG: hypothetical protein AAB319_07625 [Pseudomonadota bacterium]
MKIAAASFAFSAQHSAASSFTLQESLRAWVGPLRPESGEGQPRRTAQPSISEQARSARAQEKILQTASAMAAEEAITAADNDPVMLLIKSMVEMLTGRVIRVFSAAQMQAPQALDLTDPSQAAQSQPRELSLAQASAGFGIEYDRHEILSETEHTAFQAGGIVRTADGKEIRFLLELAMQRSYREESHLSLRAGDRRKTDPLVINFGGSAAQLQNRRFSFDLAGNGQLENVPLLAGNSGYLALDLNGNGKIDSGQELFGPASGNGFADLARYDSDNSGWIDENDPVFGQLRVWKPGVQGSGSLSSLQEQLVGALFLSKLATPFELRDGANQSLGAVRASGIFLAENGSPGSLQQIDLSV